MLLKFLKIFLSILFSFIVVFLILFTFFVDKNSSFTDDNMSFLKTDFKTYELSFSGTHILKKEEITQDTGAFMQNIDKLSSIYFTNSGSFSTVSKNKNLTISLGSGEFILALDDLTSNYKVVSKGFDLELLGGGIVYINTISTKNVIFSLDASLKLSLQEEDGKKEVTSIYLFPRSYIKFNPKNNKELYNTDLLRIRTKISNGYFKHNLDSETNLTKLLDTQNISFFKMSYGDILAKQKEYEEAYYNLKQISIYSFPGNEYIEKYLGFLVNDSKKIVFYKNKIFKDLVTIFNSDKIRADKIRDVSINLEKLEKISLSDYDEMIFTINGFYAIVLYHNNLDNQYALYNFVNLLTRINRTNVAFDDFKKSFNYLKQIYLYYDNKKINYYFKIFIEKLFTSFEIKDNKVVFDTNTNKRLIESFLFYLEDFIEYKLFADGEFVDNNSDLEITNYILKNYLVLNNTIYFSDNDYDLVKTGFIKNKKLLSLVKEFIFNYLLEESDEQNENQKIVLLTQKNTASSFKQNQIRDLQKNIDFIIKLYTDNFLILDEKKDKILSRIYLNFKDKFSEYFLALTDYTKYLTIYDVRQKGLIEHINREDNSQEKNYSTRDVVEYLSQFYYVNTESIVVTKTDRENVFSVKNYIVKGNNMGFEIDFNNSKNINNIYINGEPSYKSYPLDDIELDWAEKLSYDNKNKYDFKNFFDSIFFAKNSVSKNTNIVDDEEIITESKVISAFKRKILSSSGDFGKLKGFLDIKYKDLIVKGLDDIFIKDSVLHTYDNSKAKGASYSSNLSSKYYLDDNNKGYFYDRDGIKLLVHKNIGTGTNTMFGGNKINIIGKILLGDFKNTMFSLSQNFEVMNNVYFQIEQSLGYQNVNINYSVNDNKVVFKLENNGKTINIVLLGEKVISIKKVNREYIKNPIDYNSIKDILDKLK